MNYYYEEWENMKTKGKIRFILDVENLMIALIFIFIFSVIKIITEEQFTTTKDCLFYIIYMMISFSILLTTSQLIKWTLYRNFFNKNSNKKSIFIRLSEIAIGILNLWMPLGIFNSIYKIGPNSYIVKNINFTLDYVAHFTIYVLSNCIFWVFIGIILEFLLNIESSSRLKKRGVIYIFSNKVNI